MRATQPIPRIYQHRRLLKNPPNNPLKKNFRPYPRFDTVEELRRSRSRSTVELGMVSPRQGQLVAQKEVEEAMELRKAEIGKVPQTKPEAKSWMIDVFHDPTYPKWDRRSKESQAKTARRRHRR